MSVEIVRKDAVDVVRVSGSIDGKTAPAVGAGFAPALEGTHDLVLDLTAVDYVSSAGLRLLLNAYRKTQGESRKIVLAGVRDEIQQVMSHTGFLPFFTVVADEEAAIRVLAAAG